MTTYLVDTHALIWWWLEDETLSRKALKLITAPNTDLRVSAVTAFEIGQKVRIGKLPSMAEPLKDYDGNLRDAGIVQVAVIGDHALRAGLMAGRHRDPFDRMIAAQALIEDLTVVTCDPAFAAFGCKTFW